MTYYEGYVTDDRGVRNFMFMRTFQTGLDIQFRYLNNKPDIPAQILRAGLMYRNAKVDQEPENFTQRELYLTAAAQIGISRHISLDGKGYLGILDAGGEFRLEANARLSLFKDARTWAQWVIYQRQPNLTESRLFISQQPVWNFDFNNLALSSLSFHYDHPSLRLKLHGGFHLISNLIYYDEQRIPQQLGSTAEVLQLSAQKEFVFGPLGVMGHLMFQEYDADQIALPHLIFTGQIFYTGKWFKQRLLVRTGLDVLVTDTYQGVSYFPVTGQFYYDPAFDIAQYPAVDAFFSLQVRDFFKAFAKLENVTAYLTDDHFVEVAGYPHFETYFRFGLWMRLFN